MLYWDRVDIQELGLEWGHCCQVQEDRGGLLDHLLQEDRGQPGCLLAGDRQQGDRELLLHQLQADKEAGLLLEDILKQAGQIHPLLVACSLSRVDTHLCSRAGWVGWGQDQLRDQ